MEEIRKSFKETAKVGDGATLCWWTDREAYTIIARTANTLTLRRCRAILSPDFKPEFIPGGFCGTVVNQNDQRYTYEEDEQGKVIKAHWSNKYKCFRWHDMRIIAGRREFYDYNF